MAISLIEASELQFKPAVAALPSVHTLDPLTDPRWPEFLAWHPHVSIFHTRGWLGALRTTYGFEPIVFTTSTGPRLSDGVVYCHVRSPITGRRLVSLPFSDHCQPLASGKALHVILDEVSKQQQRLGLRYVEMRPRIWELDGAENSFDVSERVSFQTIDLRPELLVLYKGMHDSCIRRKIKRAEREGLTYEKGRSDDLLDKFRKLLFLTRRRHKLPPQPAAWFRNLAACLGNCLQVHLLSKDGVPLASIMTLHHGREIVYKYGCSDARFNNLGGTPWLFWKVIQQAKEEGAEMFDLGRSDYSDPGLIAFKEHLGASSTELSYYRSPVPVPGSSRDSRIRSWAGDIIARLPDPLFGATGQLSYRHLG
jgi:CelD/BcsL family acetyltransferase involved in cellulose biosynthesis